MTTTKTIPAMQAEQYGHGMCVAMIEDNGYHDSYFKGIFAVPVEGGGYRFETKTTGATAYSGGFIPAEDATDEVLAAYRARRDEVFADLAAKRAEDEKRQVAEGKPVTIVNPPTRGKNKTEAGAVGVVQRKVLNDFDSRWAKEYGHRTYRVQVRLAGDEERTIWLDEDRVRVTGYENEDPYHDMSNVEAVIAGAWPAR